MRYYYRCQDCLAVCAADGERLRNAECGACGGKIEVMGQVTGCRITRTEHRCPCDHRCTNAVGPNCECSCGGVNHGSHKLVEVIRDCGPVPKLGILSTTRQKGIAAEWRAAVALVLERIKAINAGRSWLPEADYWQCCKLQRGLMHARGLRTHAGRMKAIAALEVQPAAA